MSVSVARGYGRHAPPLARLARASLHVLGEDGSELSLALVGDDEMQRLNRDYRGKDRPTDVLAFAQREGEALRGAGSTLLGDVVIAVPTAARQAAERGHDIERELAELLVHGILHLLGYDHERSPAEARRMFAKQRAVLAEVLAGADAEAPPRGRAAAARAGRRSARRPA